ncbi:hypothetical protein N7539_006735 [Penicillium diatomitis]|uniref:Uncharacterized protein n=1 Tax=Penicillium diatomitis TaxID=2819901 RepID=A0A9W9X2Z1_9EURO|nr:uncharacterized protein N7539_006735 [Penicillium diatomitis]KAJ5480841.1 hypothetical protein N7539_006735 [Penicillium diatomitis]
MKYRRSEWTVRSLASDNRIVSRPSPLVQPVTHFGFICPSPPPAHLTIHPRHHFELGRRSSFLPFPSPLPDQLIQLSSAQLSSADLGLPSFEFHPLQLLDNGEVPLPSFRSPRSATPLALSSLAEIGRAAFRSSPPPPAGVYSVSHSPILIASFSLAFFFPPEQSMAFHALAPIRGPKKNPLIDRFLHLH